MSAHKKFEKKSQQQATEKAKCEKKYADAVDGNAKVKLCILLKKIKVSPKQLEKFYDDFVTENQDEDIFKPIFNNVTYEQLVNLLEFILDKDRNIMPISDACAVFFDTIQTATQKRTKLGRDISAELQQREQLAEKRRRMEERAAVGVSVPEEEIPVTLASKSLAPPVPLIESEEMPELELPPPLTECAKLYRTASWVTDTMKGIRRVQSTQIKERTELYFRVAPSEFFESLCKETSTFDDKTKLLKVGKKLYYVKYSTVDERGSNLIVVDLSNEIFERQKSYMKAIYGSFEDKIEYEAGIPFEGNDLATKLVVEELQKYGLNAEQISEILVKLTVSSLTVNDAFNNVAKLTGFFGSVFLPRLQRNFYLGNPFLLELSPELKADTNRIDLLEYFKEKQKYDSLSLKIMFLTGLNKSLKWFKKPEEPQRPENMENNCSNEVNLVYDPDSMTCFNIFEQTSDKPVPPIVKEKIKAMFLDYVSEEVEMVAAPIVTASTKLPSLMELMNEAISQARQRFNSLPEDIICKRCKTNILVGEYRTVKMSKAGQPEIVNYCSSKCMDEH